MTSPRAVVLVEGESDRVALSTLAPRRGHDLATAGVQILAMGGITNTYKHLLPYVGSDVRLAGLYDAPEERHVRSALERTGVAPDGFFACRPDLEYELIRALGTDGFTAIVAAEGETRSLRLLAGMPAQQGWPYDEVLHRFLGSQGGRKARYARRCVEVLDLDAMPAPLDAVLTYALRP